MEYLSTNQSIFKELFPKCEEQAHGKHLHSSQAAVKISSDSSEVQQQQLGVSGGAEGGSLPSCTSWGPC